MATPTITGLGERLPLGQVPERMYAATIRPERYGQPVEALRIEEVPVPRVGPGQVLVRVMAAGVNFNNVWACLGLPFDAVAAHQKRGASEGYHIGGSEGSGVVWAVGDGVRSVAPGEAVVLSSCRWDERASDIRLGMDPMLSETQSVWGYEDNFGSFAQFTVVEDYQCLPKPARLTWEEAACYMLTGATAYRQLLGWEPNVVRPGDPVLVWGGAGGLGSMAIQITRVYGGIPVAVVSDDARIEYCERLGARGVIDRRRFEHWGRMPDIDDSHGFQRWLEGARAFGRSFWEALGESRSPRIVFEHSGEETLPTSLYVCDRGGMVVLCGGTSGYNGDLDLRYLWMRQKRLQGSHFANLAQCDALNRLVADGRVDPCLTFVAPFEEIGEAHQLMYDNRHTGGNIAVLVDSPETGLTTLP